MLNNIRSEYVINSIKNNHKDRKIMFWGKNDELKDFIIEHNYSVSEQYISGAPIWMDGHDKKYIPFTNLDEICKYYYLILPFDSQKITGDSKGRTQKEILSDYGLIEERDFVYYEGQKILLEKWNGSEQTNYGNEIEISNNVKGYVCGINNKISISKDAKIEDLCIMVNGNNNIIKIGKSNMIRKNIIVLKNDNNIFEMGNNCRVCEDTWNQFGNTNVNISEKVSIEARNRFYIDQYGKLMLGKDCMLSSENIFNCGDGHSIFKYDKNINSGINKGGLCSELEIGEHVWIGRRATIISNVNKTYIGEGSVVGAGAVVKGRFPNNVVIAGVPAQIINSDISWSRKYNSLSIEDCNGYTKKTMLNNFIENNKRNIIQQNILEIRKIKSIVDYLKKINSLYHCLVIISVRDTLGYELKAPISDALKEIGVYNDLQNKHWRGFICINYDGQNIFEEIGETNKKVNYTNYIEELFVEVESCPYNAGDSTYIAINGIDYAVNCRGINIVIYDFNTKQVVDTVSFDTHSKGIECVRKEISISAENYLINEIHEIKKSISNICVDKKLGETNIVNKNIRMPKKFSEFEKEIVNRLNISKLLSEEGKIKVRLIFWGGSYLWNAIESLYLAFENDDKFDVKVIIYGAYEVDKKKRRLDSLNVKNTLMSKYNAELDKPDIVCFFPGYGMDTYKKEDYDKLRAYAKLFISIPFSLVKFSNVPIKEHLNKLINTDLGKKVDYFIFDRLIYGEIKESDYKNDKRFIEIGNPKFDVLFRAISDTEKKELPEEWNKIKNKKVVLWTTDHNWNNSNCVTFDLYARHIFNYYKNKDDFALIFRPHPVYINELLSNNVWSQNDLEEFRSYFKQSSNMIFDETSEYALAYSVANGIMADMNCGITITGLVLDKPIANLRRFDSEQKQPAHPKVLENQIVIDSLDACTNFLDSVYEGNDYMSEERNKAFDMSVSHFDGKNGNRIKDFIMEIYEKNAP